jgi:hypothetical protein
MKDVTSRQWFVKTMELREALRAHGKEEANRIRVQNSRQGMQWSSTHDQTDSRRLAQRDPSARG